MLAGEEGTELHSTKRDKSEVWEAVREGEKEEEECGKAERGETSKQEELFGL